MRRSSLNRFVPSRRRQIIRSFHFPLIVANAVTRSEDSQSKRGAFDFITNSESHPGHNHPLGAVTSTLTSSFFHIPRYLQSCRGDGWFVPNTKRNVLVDIWCLFRTKLPSEFNGRRQPHEPSDERRAQHQRALRRVFRRTSVTGS